VLPAKKKTTNLNVTVDNLKLEHFLVSGKVRVEQEFAGAGRDGLQAAGVLQISVAVHVVKLDESVLQQLVSGGAAVGVVLEAQVEELVALVTQRLGHFGSVAHAHFEHDLVIALKLWPRSLKIKI